MKRILTLVSICAFVAANAQTKQGTIIYERKVDLYRNIKDEQMRAMIPQFQTGNYELVFKDSISVYKSVPKDEAPDPFDGGGGNRVFIRIGGPGDNGELYKNLSSGKLLEQTSLEEKKYIITDTLSQQPWKLADETKTILNHACKKATLTTEKGNKVVAWYTEEIPVAVGPGTFNGLPGAILLVDVDSSGMVFTATEIQPAANAKELKQPTDGALITRADFSKKMDDVMGPADSKGRRIMTKDVQN